ncbi:DUF1641 domain-containing protein [Sulfurisphaera javensis]|uniref:DUF1641 domain-containing protein n=1 Tax=Sulfurisphaera javensis TaxID=2049879 RepID=A0AAT9GR36_9CREN
MEEGRIQTIDRIIEEIIKNQEAIINFIEILKELQRTGILPFMLGILQKSEENLAFLIEQNSNLIKNISIIYAILNGDEKSGEIHLADIIKLLNDQEVRRGLYLVLRILKAIGNANKES